MDNNEINERITLQLERIGAEVKRAMSLHPSNNSRHHAYAVILEELDEFWDDVKLNPSKMDDITKRIWLHDMQKELLHVAATCIRATIDCEMMGG